MSTQPLRDTLDTLLSQGLSRRIPQSKWLSFLHQLLKRQSTTHHSSEDASEYQARHAADVLLQRILSRAAVDPLLIEYLQALIYGSATRSGLELDQGPVADVITVTLHFVSQAVVHAQDQEGKWMQQIGAIESISACLGQGLLVALQTSTPFQVENATFLSLLRECFPSSPASSKSENDVASLLQSSLVFVMANLQLVTLAAQPLTSAKNMLSPRVGITLLANIGQALLVYVYGRLHSSARSKGFEDQIPLLLERNAEVMAKIELVLKTMNPAWTNEIALLRSLTGQINLIAESCRDSPERSVTNLAMGPHSKKAHGIIAGTQMRASWDQFADVAAIAIQDRSELAVVSVEPETVILLDLLVDQQVGWAAKLDSVKLCFLARRRDAAPSVTLEQSLTAFYFELFSAAVEACARVIETPPPFKGAEIYPAVWRNALCGMLPEVILQLEQWLDANPDLPVGGQRQDAPHVRVETALKAVLAVKAERFEICETAGVASSISIPAEADMTTDIVGVDTPSSQPIKAWLLRAFIEASLARPEAITDEFPGGHKLASEVQTLPQSLRMDAQLEGLALPAFFESRFINEDPVELLHRVASDPGTLFAFARELTSQIRSWLDMHDLESIARWCRILPDNLALLDTVMMFIDPVQLTVSLATVLDHQDMDEAGDEPSTLSAILLFLQLICYRYTVPPDSIKSPAGGAKPFFATYVQSSSVCYTLSDLTMEDRDLVNRWVQALFGNEGISDDLIQASLPKTLMRLSPLLFSQSIKACIYGVIDLETLRGGFSYFLQDLLCYALPGALRWLLTEVLKAPLIPILDLLASAGLEGNLDIPSTDGILSNGLSRRANSRTVYLEVLALLLDSDSCPTVVRHLTAQEFNRLVSSSRLQRTLEGSESFNVASIKARMEAFGSTARRLSEEYSWRRSLLAHAHPAEEIAWSPISDSNKTLTQELDRLGADGVASAVLIQLLGGDAGSKKMEKHLAAWCTLPPLVYGHRHSILTLINQLPFSDVLSDASAVTIVRFILLVLGLLHASDTLKAWTETKQENEDTSADLFDDDDQQNQSVSNRQSVSSDEVVSIICLRIARLRPSNPTLWQAYLDAFMIQQDCIAPNTRTQIWSWFGLQET